MKFNNTKDDRTSDSLESLWYSRISVSAWGACTECRAGVREAEVGWGPLGIIWVSALS